jgi:putative membrane protein
MTRTEMLATLAAVAFAIGAALPAAGADSDAEFVKMAANAGMMEVELGKQASAKGEHADVRAFGKKMIDDHTKAANELKQVAKGEGLAVPETMDAKHQETVDELSAKKGADFDEEYIDDMVDGHEHVVEAFRDQAAEGKTAIDKWAAKTLPTLEDHLAQASAIDAKLEAADDRADADADADADRDDDDRGTPPVGAPGPRQEPGGLRESLPGTVLPD